MTEFFETVPFEMATDIEQLSRLTYELRESRKTILQFHDVTDEAALLQKIRTGTLSEHPAYEHYLSARILADTRETARVALTDVLKVANKI